VDAPQSEKKTPGKPDADMVDEERKDQEMPYAQDEDSGA
jgi:hypothetical protein